MNPLTHLRKALINKGEEIPKKHGKWFRINIYDNNWLVLDTWNGYIFHYPNGAKPSDTNNLYRCVYVFYDADGDIGQCKTVKENLAMFWLTHINTLHTNTNH